MPISESPTPSQIATVLELMRRSQNEEDTAVFGELVRSGMSRELAARLVEFLPMAYCRVMLRSSGVQFSSFYHRASQPEGFGADPIWSAAYTYAETEVERGIGSSDLVAIAGRSAEFQAINQLLSGGSKLCDVKLTAPVLVWPKAGPDDY